MTVYILDLFKCVYLDEFKLNSSLFLFDIDDKIIMI